MIPYSEWKWFGRPAHFIGSFDCRFHMATKIGKYVVSTVGDYWPDEPVRDIMCKLKGIQIVAQSGDAKRAEQQEKLGFLEIGVGRLYETMVFLHNGEVCKAKGCCCGMPKISDYQELDMQGYNSPSDAVKGHMDMCEKFARRQ